MSTVGHDAALTIQQVVARYGLALDACDHDALGALHAEEASWSFSLGEQVVLGPFVGRDAILDFAAAAAAASEGPRERHLLTNIVVTIESETTGSALTYLTLVSIHDAAPAISATAVAHFQVKTSGASWLITHLGIEFDNPPGSEPSSKASGSDKHLRVTVAELLHPEIAKVGDEASTRDRRTPCVARR